MSMHSRNAVEIGHFCLNRLENHPLEPSCGFAFPLTLPESAEVELCLRLYSAGVSFVTPRAHIPRLAALPSSQPHWIPR